MAKPQLGGLPADPTAIAFGDTASKGAAGDNAALATHRHAAPANPVTAHESASDPHTSLDAEYTRVRSISSDLGLPAALARELAVTYLLFGEINGIAVGQGDGDWLFIEAPGPAIAAHDASLAAHPALASLGHLQAHEDDGDAHRHALGEHSDTRGKWTVNAGGDLVTGQYGAGGYGDVYDTVDWGIGDAEFAWLHHVYAAFGQFSQALSANAILAGSIKSTQVNSPATNMSLWERCN